MDEVNECIIKANECLKDGKVIPAQGYLKKALEIDFEHPAVIHALKCVSWWLDKINRLDDFHEPYEKGGYILSQWKSYCIFLERIGELSITAETNDSCQYAIKRFVFSLALGFFMELMGDGNQQDPVLLFNAGRCCKGAGSWEDALKYLEQAARIKREDSGIISELADVYALLGDEKSSKALFREAFYLDPQGIDLYGLESEMIAALCKKTGETGISGTELVEWIPVWGTIWGIFSVKRELKPVELGRLKQSILSLENELRSKSGNVLFIKPRLLNRYFWLIDHCEKNRDLAVLMDETMLKIKLIDPVVYEHYRT